MALDIFKELSNDYDIRLFSLYGGPLFKEATTIGLAKVLEECPLHFPQAPKGAIFRINGKLHSLATTLTRWRWKPDLLYFNSIVALNWYRYTRIDNRPVILHVHEADSAIDMYSKNLQTEIYTIPHHYIAVSQSVKSDLINRNVKADNISIVRPYLDIHKISKYADKRSNTIKTMNEKTITIGGAGGISWTKGVELWLLMAKYLTQMTDLPLQFVWVGANEEHHPSQEVLRFRVMAKKLGISDQVKIVPPTNFPLQEFINFDIFALTSWEESASLVLMENIALGVPTVCFRKSGGPTEFTFSPHAIIENFSPYHMAQQITHMIKDLNAVQNVCTVRREQLYKRCNKDESMTEIRKILHSLSA